MRTCFIDIAGFCGGKVQRHCIDDPYQSILQVKRQDRMAALDPSSRVFYHFARKFEAS